MRALRRSRDGLRADWLTPMGRICGAVAIAAVIVLAELVSAPASMSATSGLVAAYGFDEGSGSSVIDASMTGNTGTLSGATWTSQGKYGGALSFDGVNAMVAISASSSLNISSAMTLEAWIYPTATQSGWRTIVQLYGRVCGP